MQLTSHVWTDKEYELIKDMTNKKCLSPDFLIKHLARQHFSIEKRVLRNKITMEDVQKLSGSETNVGKILRPENE